MSRTPSDVVVAERALERLFRLTVSRRAYSRQSRAIGAVVSRAGYALLRSVDDAGELSMGALAQQCSMDPAAAARQVRSLEDDGYVTRRSDPTDGRVSVIRLTDAGRDIYRRIVAVRHEQMTEVLADWAHDDRVELATLVDRLVDDLKAVPFRSHEETP